MAGPQPNENIPFGADMFRSVKGAMSQVQALKKEIRAVDRDLAKVGKAVKGVEKFDPLHKELLGKRRDLADKIRMQEKLISQQETIRRGQHTVNNEMKEAARVGKLVSGVMHLQLAKRIIDGDATADEFVSLGLLNVQALKKASKALKMGGRVANWAGSAGGALANAIPYVAVANLVAPLITDAVVTHIFGNPELTEQFMAGVARDLKTTSAANAAQMDAATLKRLKEQTEGTARGGRNYGDIWDDPEFQALAGQMLLQRIKQIAGDKAYLEKLSDSDLNDILGDKALEAWRDTPRLRREGFALAAEDAGVASRVAADRQAREIKARQERDALDNESELHRYRKNEQTKFADIAWKLRRTPDELRFGGGFVAHGRYAY